MNALHSLGGPTARGAPESASYEPCEIGTCISSDLKYRFEIQKPLPSARNQEIAGVRVLYKPQQGSEPFRTELT